MQCNSSIGIKNRIYVSHCTTYHCLPLSLYFSIILAALTNYTKQVVKGHINLLKTMPLNTVYVGSHMCSIIFVFEFMQYDSILGTTLPIFLTVRVILC